MSKLNRQEIVQEMCRSGLLPVFRMDDPTHLVAITKAIYEGGIRCIEYTMTMPNAMQLLKDASSKLPSDLVLGMGTITDGQNVDRAVAAGAQFIASPGLSPEMLEACNRHNVASVVGVMTPTEIMTALRLGADVMKIFPAAAVSPDFFTDVLGPFPGIHLMAASKNALRDMNDFILAGAEIVTFLPNALGVEAIATGDCPAITRAVAGLLEKVRVARQTKAK